MHTKFPALMAKLLAELIWYLFISGRTAFKDIKGLMGSVLYINLKR
jgi:hypothetical protein